MIWAHRPGTNDLGIIDQGYTHNACRLPADMAGMRCIDVGAHIGAVSALAAERGAHVDAYEPIAASFALLQENIRRNHLDVSAYQLALGKGETKRLYVDTSNTGMCSEHYPTDQTEEVRVTTLEAALAGAACDFLKLDCEGCEAEVIEEIAGGLHRQIAAISCEFHFLPKDQGALEALRRLYQAEAIGSHGWLFTRR